MEELKYIEQLGIKGHVEIASTVVLVSFVIRMLYQDHIQRFLRDIRLFLRGTLQVMVGRPSPSLYSQLPTCAQIVFDLVEMVWSYSACVFALIHFTGLLVFANSLGIFKLPVINIAGYLGLALIFLYVALSALNNGNRALYSFRSRGRG